MQGSRMEPWVNAAWVGVGLAICLTSFIKYGLSSPDGPGPGLMSFLTGILMICFGAILLIKHRFARDETARGWRLPGRKFIYTLLSLFAYALLLERLGFILTTCGLLVLLLGKIGHERWYIAMLIGLAGSVGSFLLFSHLLQVQLPRGIFGF